MTAQNHVFNQDFLDVIPQPVICSAGTLSLTAADTGNASSYLSENGINAGTGFAVEVALDVHFTVAAGIVLDKGFSVHLGAEFSATINPEISCP